MNNITRMVQGEPIRPYLKTNPTPVKSKPVTVGVLTIMGWRKTEIAKLTNVSPRQVWKVNNGIGITKNHTIRYRLAKQIMDKKQKSILGGNMPLTTDCLYTPKVRG